MRAGWIVFLAFVLVVGAYVAWPYYSLDRLQDALEADDQVALDRLLDWPSVRAGIEADMKSRGLAPSVGETGGQDTGLTGRLAAVLTPAVTDFMVDAYASPAGLSRLIRERRLNPVDQAATAAVAAARDAGDTTTPGKASAAGDQLRPDISDAMQYAEDRLKEAKSYASEKVDALRAEYDYLFFTGPLTFEARYAPAGPDQISPLILDLRLDPTLPGWRLERVHLPRSEG